MIALRKIAKENKTEDRTDGGAQYIAAISKL